jgi:DNA primase
MVVDDVEAVKEQVSIYQILRDYGVEFVGGGFPEQIHCPFHFPDTNRSARVYPDSNSVYCWVCDKTFDVLEFVKDKEEVSFGEAISLLKKRYDVEIFVPDYEARLYAFRHKIMPQDEDFSAVVDRLFIIFTAALTHDELGVILSEYNECWATKEDLIASGKADADSLKQWLEQSKIKLVEGVRNG